MTPNEIDRAIDAMPDREYSELSDAAVGHWTFRVQNYVLPVAILLVYFCLCFAAFRVVPSLWPGSLIAATIVTLGLVGALWFMLKAVLSLRATDWRIRRAMRRQFKHRTGAGAP